MQFPQHFIWGAATSAYQIEGATAIDGRGESVWDRFCQRPNTIKHGHTGAVAINHYHHYHDDILLLQDIGLHAYRFSIAWPRIFPNGTGQINQAGLDFYDRLVNCLLEANITPYVTLFHWDFPYPLYCKGGWLNRDVADWFAEYTTAVVQRLGDRVHHWMPINEPQVVAMVGHFWGVHAPGDKLHLNQVMQIHHHLLLAHGKSIQAIRATCSNSVVGIAPSGSVSIPVSSSADDIEAARQDTFAITKRETINETLWLDPIFFGRYPDDGVALFGNDMPCVQPDDMATICQPINFFGINMYTGKLVQMGDSGQPEQVAPPPGYPETHIQWFVLPETLYWGPRFLWERYRTPIMITENGMANVDWVSLDGHVHDPQRIDYTQRYLLNLHRAIEDGADIRGYFHWSAFDNFEWSEGYQQRFGLIHVDYTNQQRTLKDSAYWYRDVIHSNGAVLNTSPLGPNMRHNLDYSTLVTK